MVSKPRKLSPLVGATTPTAVPLDGGPFKELPTIALVGNGVEIPSSDQKNGMQGRPNKWLGD